MAFKILVGAFFIGCVTPLILSVFAMTIDFGSASLLSLYLFPFGGLDWISDNVRVLMNGLLYSLVAAIFYFSCKNFGSSK